MKVAQAMQVVPLRPQPIYKCTLLNPGSVNDLFIETKKQRRWVANTIFVISPLPAVRALRTFPLDQTHILW